MDLFDIYMKLVVFLMLKIILKFLFLGLVFFLKEEIKLVVIVSIFFLDWFVIVYNFIIVVLSLVCNS